MLYNISKFVEGKMSTHELLNNV